MIIVLDYYNDNCGRQLQWVSEISFRTQECSGNAGCKLTSFHEIVMAYAAGDSHQVTRLLLAWSEGDQGALEKLTPLVYKELRRLAPDHTLQATALVNEAYLRLVDWKPMGLRSIASKSKERRRAASVLSPAKSA